MFLNVTANISVACKRQPTKISTVDFCIRCYISLSNILEKIQRHQRNFFAAGRFSRQKLKKFCFVLCGEPDRFFDQKKKQLSSCRPYLSTHQSIFEKVLSLGLSRAQTTLIFTEGRMGLPAICWTSKLGGRFFFP